MSPLLRRGAIASGLLHIAVLLALLIGLPGSTPEEPPRSEEKATLRPSGECRGSRLSNGPSVRRLRSEPSAAIDQRWKLPSP